MSLDDQMKLLVRLSNEMPQAEIARRIGRSASAVNQTLKGTYPNPEIILQLVDEEFGATIVECPVHGEIPLGHCAEERKKGFSTSRADIWMACRICERGGSR
jgi:transcriptional regulator with XRE-family HTH domain